jgi:hypothetical protein
VLQAATAWHPAHSSMQSLYNKLAFNPGFCALYLSSIGTSRNEYQSTAAASWCLLLAMQRTTQHGEGIVLLERCWVRPQPSRMVLLLHASSTRAKSDAPAAAGVTAVTPSCTVK